MLTQLGALVALALTGMLVAMPSPRAGATESAARAQWPAVKLPPGDAMIIMVTGSERALLDTVRSRCRPVRFGPLDTTEVCEILTRDPRPQRVAGPWSVRAKYTGPWWECSDGEIPTRKN